MPKRRARGMVLVCVLSAWLLSGCITNLAPTQLLPREAFASVSEVALAVGADGLKHYAWTECSGENASYTCVLVYARVAAGGVIYSHGFVVPIGTVARYPDVAVASNGDAYVVRSECTAVVNCVDYWSKFPADPENVEIASNFVHTVSVASKGPPRVEARGNNVYATYLLDVAGAKHLRYRQLSGGARAGDIDDTVLSPSNPSLAIDSAGNLHVVWIRNPPGVRFIAYANNTGGVNDFNSVFDYDSAANRIFSHPDIALDDDDHVYLAYAFHVGTSGDTITVRCLAPVVNDCYRDAATLTVPEADGPWHVFANVNLEMINAHPNAVFAATNDGLEYSEIWWFQPPSSGGMAATQVTNTLYEREGEPLIVKEHSTAEDIPVIGWRMFNTLLSGAQAPAGDESVCHGEVFVLYSDLSHLRQVFEDHGTCNNHGLDLAANGEWVAGVWVDEESDAIQAHAAWTSFNAYGLYLPSVGR
jgi:hypothetical protein